MHVRCVFLDGFGQYCIDEANDWCVVIALQEIGWLREVLCNLQQVDVFIEATDHLHRDVAALFIGLLQDRVECL